MTKHKSTVFKRRITRFGNNDPQPDAKKADPERQPMEQKRDFETENSPDKNSGRKESIVFASYKQTMDKKQDSLQSP